MKKILSYEEYNKTNEELSPETYDRITDIGYNRDDPRGRRIADTAKELKKKNYPEFEPKINVYLNHSGDLFRAITLKKAYDFNDNKITLNATEPGVSIELYIGLANKYEAYIGSDKMCFDKKGVNDIIKFLKVNKIDTTKINPSLFPRV